MIHRACKASLALILLGFVSVAHAKVAQIIAISGNAYVERTSHKYLAQRGMVLEEGDIVRSLKGKVTLKYDDCQSFVEAKKEVIISSNKPCAPATLAKASDLEALEKKSYKIERIDSNLAEAKCNACKVSLASGPALLTGALAGRAAVGVVGLAILGRSNGGNNTTPSAGGGGGAVIPTGNSNNPVSPP